MQLSIANAPVKEIPSLAAWKEMPQEKSVYTRVTDYFFNIPKSKKRLIDSLQSAANERISLLMNMLESVNDLLGEMRQVVASLSFSEKRDFLTQAALSSMENGKPEIFRRAAQLFHINELEQIVEIHIGEFAQRIATLFPLQESLDQDSAPSQKTMMQTLLKLLNAVRVSFNLLEAAKEPDSYYEGCYLLDIFCKLILIPITMVTFLNIFLPTMVSVGISACFLISLYGIIQLLPNQAVLPDFCEDLSELAKQGRCKYVPGRDDEVAQLARAIISNAHSHPTLTGESGVGKTSIARNLAVDIFRGRFPELSGKRVIWVNAASLIPGEGSGFKIKKPLIKLLDSLGQELNNTIIFIDELQGALLKEGALAQEFKTQHIPHYFAACTKKDYEKVIDDEGLRTRFGFNLSIESMSRHKTCRLLAEEATRIAPEFDFSPEFFDAIYQKTKDHPQPQSSRDLFGRILVTIRAHGGNSQNQNMIDKWNREIEELLKTSANQDTFSYMNSAQGKESIERIVFLRKKISDEKRELEVRKSALKRYGQLKKIWSESQKQSIRIAHELQGNRSEDKQRELLFRVFFLEPELKKKLQAMNLGNRLCNQFTEADIKTIKNSSGLND